MLDQDCATTQLTEGSPPSCIGSITVGGYLCSPDVNSYQKGGVTLFAGAWLYKLTCRLPAPQQVSTWPARCAHMCAVSATEKPHAMEHAPGVHELVSAARAAGCWQHRCLAHCVHALCVYMCVAVVVAQGDPQVGVGVAGDAGVSVSFEGRFAGGLALNKQAFMTAAPGRQPRQFQVYAQVDSVQPSTGSLAGGTVITLRGRGFPSSLATAGTAITTLRVGGLACRLLSSSFDTMTCMTQAEPATPLPANPWCRWNSSSGSNSTYVNGTVTNGTAPGDMLCWDGSVRGLFPGMRGVYYEYFNRCEGAAAGAWPGTAGLPHVTH